MIVNYIKNSNYGGLPQSNLGIFHGNVQFILEYFALLTPEKIALKSIFCCITCHRKTMSDKL